MTQRNRLSRRLRSIRHHHFACVLINWFHHSARLFIEPPVVLTNDLLKHSFCLSHLARVSPSLVRPRVSLVLFCFLFCFFLGFFRLRFPSFVGLFAGLSRWSCFLVSVCFLGLFGWSVLFFFPPFPLRFPRRGPPFSPPPLRPSGALVGSSLLWVCGWVVSLAGGGWDFTSQSSKHV